jgi:hypothetical protein
VHLSRYRRGDDIAGGIVFRRVPNWSGYYDHAARQPRRVAFEPRPQDNGALSAHLSEDEAKAVLSKRKGFGLVSLDIEQMKAGTSGKVRVEYFPTALNSHVRVWGCDGDIEVQEALAALATTLIPPTPR